jgi:hypothetical protein
MGCFVRRNSDGYAADIIPSRDVYDMGVVYKTISDIKSELGREKSDFVKFNVYLKVLPSSL